MKKIIIFFAFMISSVKAEDDLSRRYKIFHVSIDVPLADTEDPRREYYVNVGSNQGVKKGVVLAVYRTISVPDQFEGRIPRDAYVKIATLRVRSSEYDSSIAEVIEMEKDRPVLDVDSIMLGDEVQLEFNDEHPL